jgi:protein-S-isoprenylcysteine O-methyltransferase Ste14
MKKLLGLLFGIISYVMFLGVILYAIGFVGNFIVPKSIDSGAESAVLPALLINVGLLSIFGLQHSIMARPEFKSWWTKIVGKNIERSIYVLFSNLALILLYWKWQTVSTVIWSFDAGLIFYLLIGIYVLGWTVVFLSTFMISHFHLFGLTQVFYNFKQKTISEFKFQTNYLYKIVRHPIMLGFLIVVWAAPTMTVGRLIFAIVSSLYIFVAVKYLEERDLKKVFGEQYLNYQKNVPMLIPFTKINNNVNKNKEQTEGALIG